MTKVMSNGSKTGNETMMNYGDSDRKLMLEVYMPMTLTMFQGNFLRSGGGSGSEKLLNHSLEKRLICGTGFGIAGTVYDLIRGEYFSSSSL